MLASAATARRNFSGFFSSRPQPSPVLPSAAIAPRWVRRLSEVMAVWTSQWLGWSSRLAIRPKPQLSRSYDSRKSPRSPPAMFSRVSSDISRAYYTAAPDEESCGGREKTPPLHKSPVA